MQPYYTIPQASGIYRIVCTSNKRFYIGSAANLRARSRDHLSGLRRNAHDNQKLQRAFNKYGEASFIFEVIEFVLLPFLLEREQYWLDKLQPFGEKGFNIAHFANSTMGLSPSPEARAKSRATHLGKKASHETKKKM